jgi:hypothetical protein
LAQNLSNPKKLINHTSHSTSKLPQRGLLATITKNITPGRDQNTIFPEGLAYDVKKEHYRTPIVNSVFGHVADLSKALSGNKKRDLSILLEKSPVVPYGSDLSNLMSGFQSLRELMNSTRSHFRL